ncbi:MAG TPA: PQQ-dependent sugar dehydrogenase [Pyrinomonadaceae bacterium]|nr:PQQ-dependent sugar dehydrogenase [Pyrinomonadaceae bacterium]
MKKTSFWAGIALCLMFLAVNSFAGGALPATPKLQPFLTGLSRPVLIRSANDGTGRLFILQQGGLIRVLQPGATTPTDFINLSSKITVPVSVGDERGLLGLTFHPQFATNGYFFVNYTRVGDGVTVIARYTASNNNTTADIATERVILTITQPFSNHNGGMIDFGPDGNLYIGMGDGGSANDPGARAQNINELLGKFLRITPDVSGNNANPPYTVPADNPYVGVAGADEIYAIGIRNPWRWSFDRGGTNQLWAGDVGQNNIEEFDIITRGANYGWRVYEGTTCTNLDPALCAGGGSPITQTPPLFTYTHTGGRCSITGGYVYRGTQGALPNGAYTYADYCSGEIWYWFNNTSTLLTDTTRSVVSFGEDQDGEIYVCFNNGTIDKIVRSNASADFDGDFKTDTAVFRPSAGSWYILNSFNNSFAAVAFGNSTDTPVPEDYDGDNVADVAVFRPSTGNWFYLRSINNTFGSAAFGANGDVPVAGDYDGDQKADFTVFRNGNWYRLNSSNSQFVATAFGTTGDIPVPSDYDGDGKYDVTVFRPSNGTWYRLNSNGGGFSATTFGQAGDVPVPGDYDGDGRSDITVFRDGNWYSLRSATGSFVATAFGTTGDVPVAGDYDGDGKEDIAVFRNGNWYSLRSATGSFVAVAFGTTGDLPAPAYDRP